MKTLIIPDVHLDFNKLEKAMTSFVKRADHVIFLGDFFDDFNDTPEANVKMARILKTEILGKEKITVLMGNHDLNYHPLCLPEWRCSGFSLEKKAAIGEVLTLEDYNNFVWATTAGGEKGRDALVTHAGLHPDMLPWGCEVDPQSLANYLNEKCQKALTTQLGGEPLLQAGRSRYGHQPHGGIIWMDVREYEHIEGLRQIFGHTPLRSPYKVGPPKEYSLCMDSQLSHLLLIKGKQWKVLETIKAPKLKHEQPKL